jgi:hypothetical protein
MKKTVKFSHTTRHMDRIEVLPLIDREKALGFDIFEYGLFLTGSGAYDQDIEAGLTNLVEQEKDGDLQLLKRMPKMQGKIPELALAAVEQNGLALEFVVNQTAKIIKAAIAQNSEAAKFIRNKGIQNVV